MYNVLMPIELTYILLAWLTVGLIWVLSQIKNSYRMAKASKMIWLFPFAVVVEIVLWPVGMAGKWISSRML